MSVGLVLSSLCVLWDEKLTLAPFPSFLRGCSCSGPVADVPLLRSGHPSRGHPPRGGEVSASGFFQSGAPDPPPPYGVVIRGPGRDPGRDSVQACRRTTAGPLVESPHCLLLLDQIFHSRSEYCLSLWLIKKATMV